jgi:hypothetical protein
MPAAARCGHSFKILILHQYYLAVPTLQARDGGWFSLSGEGAKSAKGARAKKATARSFDYQVAPCAVALKGVYIAYLADYHVDYFKRRDVSDGRPWRCRGTGGGGREVRLGWR